MFEISKKRHQIFHWLESPERISFCNNFRLFSFLQVSHIFSTLILVACLKSKWKSRRRTSPFWFILIICLLKEWNFHKPFLRCYANSVSDNDQRSACKLPYFRLKEKFFLVCSRKFLKFLFPKIRFWEIGKFPIFVCCGSSCERNSTDQRSIDWPFREMINRDWYFIITEAPLLFCIISCFLLPGSVWQILKITLNTQTCGSFIAQIYEKEFKFNLFQN